LLVHPWTDGTSRTGVPLRGRATVSRCTRCIMPETFPGISFDARGVCSFCLQHGARPSHLRRDDLLERIRSVETDTKYECVVPLSGGKDSTYILYCTVRDLGLRAIAASYDSGYQSEIARKNVRRACDELQVPLVTLVPDQGVQRRMLREMLLVSEAVGCFTRTCTSCEFMLRMLAIGVARTHDVPFILWGSSALESPDDVGYEEYRHGRTPLQIAASKASRLRSLRLTWGQVAALVPHLVTYTALSARQRREVGAPLKYILNPYGLIPFPERAPTVIHFFDYANWDPQTATELLERELGWEHPDDRDARFDCRLYCFVEHRKLKLTGLSDSGAILCRLIREGMLTRADALATEEATRHRVVSECAEIVNEAGLRDYRIAAF
jgi:glucosamine--fructose-6-phosphate aminotransferase (isomerizing)